jgi:hypothetical protein
MKNHLAPVFIALTAIGFLLTGCGRGATKMDTSEFEAAFATADPSVKGLANDAVKALKADKYFEGATALANIAKSADKLDEAQKNAMINLGATIQLIMSEDGDKADLKVYQAVEDMIAALDGRESAKVGTTPDRVLPPLSQE